MAHQSLGQLRLRLTAWYAITLGVIITLLGGGLFLAIRHQIASQLEESVHDATVEVARAARIREMEAQSATGPVVDALDELRIPDRALYLMAMDGRPIKPDSAAEWIQQAARRAATEGRTEEERDAPGNRTLLLNAERFNLASGEPLVAIVVADEVELEDRFASLIAAFAAAAAVALVLVAAGGWLLVRTSTEPVERSIEYMRRFMADAAHELRTPISVLRTRAEVALQQPRDAATYESALRTMAVESARLGRLVDDLLTLARVDSGEWPVRRERTFLDDLALDAASAARVMAEGKGVALSVGDFEEAPVDGDPALLRQLMMILLDNAVKFTPASGSVQLDVAVVGGRPTVVIEDTGVGIPSEQLPHVFDRFYRGDAARSRTASSTVSEGTGLGLAIARWISDVHDARIELDSAPGRGTRVVVRFPTAREPAPAARDEAMPPGAAGTGSGSLSRS